MVGTAKKNENSAAAWRDKPCCMPPIIEAAERLVPGIIAKHCQKPMATALRMLTSFSEKTVGLVNHLSTNNNTIPPIISITAIGRGLPKTASILSSNNLPNTKAGITAQANFTYKPKLFLSKNLRQYITTTDKILPNWMETMNIFTKASSCIPKNELVNIMWAVEDTGKNSVKPSTIAMMIASKKFI